MPSGKFVKLVLEDASGRQEPALSLASAAAQFRVPLRTLAHAASTGALETWRVGRRQRLTTEMAVQRWLGDHAGPGRPRQISLGPSTHDGLHTARPKRPARKPRSG